MIPGLSKRLSRAIEQKRLREKLERDLQAVRTELRSESGRLDSLGARLKKEEIDVDRLERVSLTYLFYTVLGSRDQQLEKERQDLLSAQLGYQQTRDQVEYLEQERTRLSNLLEGLAGTESEYESALSEKERALRQSDQPVARQLLEISEDMAGLQGELKEITEAIQAGNSVLSDLDQAIKSLERADHWGSWDMWSSGVLSLVIDETKHSHIDQARKSVTSAQAKISRFKRELADVQRDVEVQINIGESLYYADVLLDCLVVDWIVQSKIDSSLAQSKHARAVIAQAVAQLEAAKEGTQGKCHEMKERRALLVEQG